MTDIIRFGVTLNIFGYASNTFRLRCNNGPDWFLWALFVGELIFVLIHRLFKNQYIIWIVSAAIGLFMILYHDCYATFGSTGVGFLFLTVGFYAYHIFEVRRSLTITLAVGMISVVACCLNGKVDLWAWNFGSVLLYVVSALAGTFLVIQGSQYIYSRLLTYYGQNSLTVLGTHQVINLPIRTLSGISEYSPLMGTLVFLLIALIELPIIYLFDRCIPFLIGKKKRGIIGDMIVLKSKKKVLSDGE